MSFRIGILLVLLVHLLVGESKAAEIPEERPRIGLVLSGGGAKGLVYIPLLKAIDSLGIKVDYIAATSMGALVGGLYSIGYSGNELDSLARNLDWESFLSDNLPMSKINMEEKDEYGKYLLELKNNNLIPSLPMGIIEGQNILRFFNDLTFNVQHIQDFSKFKIPFKCFAADIVRGVPVEINSGSLALALRTTMSIPTVFTPIEADDMLLVDGGIVKNFPVEDVIEMGADFVIGGNCSGYSLKKKELTSLLRVFEQMLNVSTTEDYQKQKDLCDLLLDFSEALNLEGYGSSDFNSASAIIDLGERVVKNFIPFLAQVAEDQKAYFALYPEIETDWRKDNELVLNKFQVSIDDNDYQAIIKNKIEFKDPNDATTYEINRAVDRVYGTRFFDRVYYYLDVEQDSTPKLVFKTEGAKKFAYKLGLHYDPELSAGITVNLTYRKLGKYTSRSMLSLDISNNPKLRAGYQVYFGDSGWWLNTEQFFSSISQVSYARRKALGDYNHLYSSSNLSVNWTIGQNNLVSIGSAFEYLNRKSSIRDSDRTSMFNSGVILSKSPYYNVNFFLKLARNTLDKHFFPTKGIFVQSYLKYVPWGDGSQSVLESTVSENGNTSAPVLVQKKPEFSAYGKWHLQMEQYIPLHKIFTLHYRWDAGLMFMSHGLSGRAYEFSSQDAFFMGGVDLRERERLHMYVPFWGNREGYAQAFNFTQLTVEGQVQPLSKLYVIPRISVMAYDDGNVSVYGDELLYINQLKDNIKWAVSGGAAVAYDSPIGPIKMSVARASNYDKWIFYVALGYRF